LIKAFRDACPADEEVIATDADPLAPAFVSADRGIVVPSLSRSGFVDEMLSICEAHGVRLLVPTIDTELALYADSRERFEAIGVTPLISSPRLIEVTSSKRRTEEVFGNEGIRSPRSWPIDSGSLDDLPSEVFVKPDRGSASENTFRAGADNLAALVDLVPDALVQERIDAVELTVDALLDLEGRPIHLVPRVRLKTVGGESVQGVTVPDEPVRAWLVEVLRIVGGLGGRGPITIQAFLTEPEPTLIEVNPRFGGGFPLAYEAGARYPQWILRFISGKAVEPSFGSYRKGVFMTRTFVEFFSDGGWEQ
jgi:carbamoyl-phosphate synthase large subunit